MKRNLLRIYKFIEWRIVTFCGRIFVRHNKYCNVIYYHDIVRDDGYSYMRTNIDVFKSQMQYLLDNGYETLRFDDFSVPENIIFKKKRVLIAFDDGWLSNYTEIFAWMKERHIKYNVFLSIGQIDEDPSYLTWNMVREMHDSGLCGFGTHTFTHADMSDLSKIDMSVEIYKANAIFYQELGYEPLDFCYPFGYHSENSNFQLERDTNYKRIYTSDRLYSYIQNEKLIMGRNGVETEDSIDVFKDKLAGYCNFQHQYNKMFLKPILAIWHMFHRW